MTHASYSNVEYVYSIIKEDSEFIGWIDILWPQ